MTFRAGRGLAAALCALALTTAVRGVEAPRVSAQLEPDPLGKDELATLTLVVESSGFGTVDVEPDFRLDNFQLAGGPFRSSSQSWVNGVTSSSTQLVWRLRPLTVGPAAVRAFRVSVEGVLVQLPDAALEVVAEAPQRAAPQRRAPPDPFGSLFGNDPFGNFDRSRPRPPQKEPKLRMLAVVEPPTAWLGQQLVWRLLLDTQTDVSRVEPRQVPDFRGFWVRDITPEETPSPRWIEVEGERYARVPVIERALFALEAGSPMIPSVDVQVVAQVVEVDFYRPRARPRMLELSSGPAKVTVRPLPPRPAGFAAGDPGGLIVGRLEVATQVDRARLEAGQAASLTLRATSNGNLQAIEPPAWILPDGLRSFPPIRESEEKVIGGRLESTVRWRYVLLADRAGSYSLPAVEMPYFDPESTAYRTARSTPLELVVTEPAASARSAGPAAPVAAPAPSAEPAPVGNGKLPVWLAWVAGALALSGLGAILGARRRRTGRPAQRLSAALAGSEREPSARAAAALIEEGWRSFLDERWSIPRSLPVAQWSARLVEAGAPGELGKELAALFEELHFLAYAPELADVDAHRAEVLARSRRLLRRLR